MSDAKDYILIADDQPDNLLILDNLLGGSYTVHGVGGGRAALRYIEEGGPVDLILLDVVMPDLDGFEVCRRLKADPATREIPVIFLTGLESDADEALGLSLGAEDFIHKPISPSVVLARVSNHLKLRRATRLLRERSEDMERLATEAAGLGIWDYDVTGNRMAWNDEMFRQYGIAPQSFTGSFIDLFTHIHPDDIDRMKREYRIALEGERDIALEFRVIRPGGDIRVLKANATIRRDGGGNPVRLLGTNWDVTDYRRALEELGRAKAQAEAASVAKSNFLASMSHELRTPLNAIIGFGRMLRESETRPDWIEQLDIICQAADSLLKIIQDILDLSKIEAGRITVNSQLFDLSDEVGLVARYFQPEVARKGLEFKIAIGRTVPARLNGDAGLLRQVLINLIGNAIKFTVRGRVDLAVEMVDGRGEGKVTLAFHVTDTGPGIKDENQARVFDIFEQEDNTTTRRHGGVGLGLAISRRLVTLMGGRIGLRSTPGVGSRFSFTVVMEPAAPSAPARPTLVAAPFVPAPGSGASGARILVVEDDRFCLKLMVGLLNRNGYQVSFAEDGESALALLRSRPFDIVLMDVQLPEVSGLEVTRRVRAGEVEGCDPAIPIIAITAFAMREDKARCLDQGMTAYVSKPIDVTAFTQAIRTVLSDRIAHGG